MGSNVSTPRHGAPLRPLLIGTAAVVCVELTTGVLSGSIAIIGDAVHLTTDLGALALTAFTIGRQRRGPTNRHTYGFHRAATLVAAVNGVALLASALVLAVAAVLRLSRPPSSLSPLPVIVAAGFALAVNSSLALWLFRTSHTLSVRSAALHVAADAATSGGVIAAGLVVLVTGWTQADSLVSLGIAGLILVAAIRLTAEAVHILADKIPRDLSLQAVQAAMLEIPGIDGVHDLHLWSLDRDHRMLTAHVSVAERSLAEVTTLLQTVESKLCDRFSIEHATLQPECPSCLPDAALLCDVDERHTVLHHHDIPRRND